jgi:hypothetical protein
VDDKKRAERLQLGFASPAQRVEISHRPAHPLLQPAQKAVPDALAETEHAGEIRCVGQGIRDRRHRHRVPHRQPVEHRDGADEVVDEAADLRSCRPGRCNIRLGGAGIATLQKSVDVSAPDSVDRINAFARKAALEYVSAYQSRGDEVLVTYNDRAQPVSLQEQWRGILGNAAYFHEYAPELKTYLEQYPRGSLPGARDVFYWVKENYGLKPVLSIVHGVIYQPPSRADRTFVVQKQIYASHYYDGSLAIATALSATENGAPVTYLVYANRSRGDMLRGGFGGLKRNVAQSKARKAAQETLGTIKRQLEQ